MQKVRQDQRQEEWTNNIAKLDNKRGNNCHQGQPNN